MISAFGVEHGEISKGLPSALRGGGGKSTYAIDRRLANKYGKRAAKQVARSGNDMASAIMRRGGLEARKGSRRSLETTAYYRKLKQR